MNPSALLTAALFTSLLVQLSACDSRSELPESLSRDRGKLVASEHLLCRYRKSGGGDPAKEGLWYFWRQKDRTETYDERSRQGEIWVRDPTGAVFYHRVFFPQQAILEYNPGDLAAAGVEVSWDHLYSIIDPALLSGSTKGPASSAPDGTEYHERTLAGGTREVIAWLPDLRLPVRVTHSDGAVQDELRLLDCEDSARAAFRPVEESIFANFRQVEFSDLGDMESDPTVRQITALLGGHHHD